MGVKNIKNHLKLLNKFGIGMQIKKGDTVIGIGELTDKQRGEIEEDSKETHLLDLIIVSEMVEWIEKISSKQKSCIKEKMLRD